MFRVEFFLGFSEDDWATRTRKYKHGKGLAMSKSPKRAYEMAYKAADRAAGYSAGTLILRWVKMWKNDVLILEKD